MSESHDDLFDFFDHWPSRQLSDLADVISPGFPCGDHNQEGDGVPHLRPMNISEDGEIDLSKVKCVEEEYTPLRSGDVLFNNTNSPALVGKTAHIDRDREWAHSNHMTRIRGLPEGLSSKWVAHWLHFLFQDGYFRMHCRNHVNQASIGVGFLEDKVEVPLPTLSEQRRIVAKIEELFSDLDAGVADLKRAKKQLQRYRQSVLQAAVEGRLTKAWREERDAEPADKLLERILEERRAQWEKDYRAKYEAKGKEPPSGWKSRYKPAEELDTSDLPELPEGWVWTSMDQLLSNVRNGYSKAPKAESGVPILRISAVRPLSVDLSDVRYLEGKPEDYEKYLIEPGYLLFVRYNGNPELVGVCGTVKELDQEYAHPDKLIRGEVAEPEVAMPRFLEMAFNVGESRDHVANRVRTTAGQAGISQGDIYSAPVPIPPPEEQRQIVNEVERLLSVADEATQTVEREIKRAERLRQSILKQAFSGKLVECEEAPSPNRKDGNENVVVADQQIEMAL